VDSETRKFGGWTPLYAGMSAPSVDRLRGVGGGGLLDLLGLPAHPRPADACSVFTSLSYSVPYCFMVYLQASFLPAVTALTVVFGTSLSLVTPMMEAVNTSEKSVNFYQTTRHNILEDSPLHHLNLFLILFFVPSVTHFVCFLLGFIIFSLFFFVLCFCFHPYFSITFLCLSCLLLSFYLSLHFCLFPFRFFFIS
jgi:hypothetical protein